MDTFSKKVCDEQGLDPATILLIIQLLTELLPLLKDCRNVEKLAEGIVKPRTIRDRIHRRWLLNKTRKVFGDIPFDPIKACATEGLQECLESF